MASGLEQQYIVPPFSVLDSKQGYWQKRKRSWLNIGIESEVGRGENLLKFSDTINQVKTNSYGQCFNKLNEDKFNKVESRISNGTSIFDPVLCEICYKWFCPKGGSIFDPFAGGSVRGIVAGKLGYPYTGIELSENQVIANREQAIKLSPDIKPDWIIGDSRKSGILLPVDKMYDLIFSCPPYYDLEVYSSRVDDMSNASSYKDFLLMYGASMRAAIDRLRNNRFMIYVVTNIRDKKGFYRDFVSDTISLAAQNGLHLYNDIILVNCVGTLALRINGQFPKYRKVGKMHQNILVFYKGDDPKQISSEFDEIKSLDEMQNSLNKWS